MSAEVWFWIFVLFSIAQPVVLFFGRNWLKARIEKGIEHRFSAKLEELRSELRNNEEEIKSEIRKRETEVNVLRERVLNARAGRQTLVDKRRIEAIEKVWDAVTSLNAFRIQVTTMTIVNFETASREAHRNPKFRQFIEMISGAGQVKAEGMKFANTEQLYVSEIAWSLYSTYFMIIAIAGMQIVALKSGLSDTSKMFKTEDIVSKVISLLPEYEKYLKEHGLLACYHLCDEIHGRIFKALREDLTGKEVEIEDINRVNNLNWELKKVEMQQSLIQSGFQHLGQPEP